MLRAVIRSTVATSSGVLLVALAWASARYYAWEPIDVRRDSWAYTFKVSRAAKQFKLWSPRTQPLFDVARGAGHERNYNLIRYHSDLSLQQLQARVQDEGFRCVYYGTAAVVCDRAKAGVFESQVSAMRAAAGTELTVQVQVL